MKVDTGYGFKSVVRIFLIQNEAVALLLSWLAAKGR